MICSCECCHRTTVETGAYCLDGNAEVELCKRCARELLRECDVVALDGAYQPLTYKPRV
jgi:hypothetical protein